MALRLTKRIQYGVVVAAYGLGASLWGFGLLVCEVEDLHPTACHATADEGHDHGAAEQASAVALAPAPAVPIETAQASDLASLGASSLSWAGEVLSDTDLDVYPARDGQLVAWSVELGQTVTKGQVLGRLAPAPLTPELASNLTQLAREAEVARANAAATVTLVDSTKRHLALIQKALARAKAARARAGEADIAEVRQASANARRELDATQAARSAAVRAVDVAVQERQQAAQAAEQRLVAAETVRSTAQSAAAEELARAEAGRTTADEALQAVEAAQRAAVARATTEVRGAEQAVAAAQQSLASAENQQSMRAAAAQGELAAAETTATAQTSVARSTLEAVLQRTAGALYRSTPRTPQEALTAPVRAGVGARNPGAIPAFRTSLSQLLTDPPERVPDAVVLGYARALGDILAASEPSDELPDALLEELRRDAVTDVSGLTAVIATAREAIAMRATSQAALEAVRAEAGAETQRTRAELAAAQAALDAARADQTRELAEAERERSEARGAVRAAEADVDVASAEAARARAEADQAAVEARTAVATAQAELGTAQAEAARAAAEATTEVVRGQSAVSGADVGAAGAGVRRDEVVASAEAEYAQATAEVEGKLAELDRELAVAKAEEAAAAAAYTRFSAGAIGQEIVAQQAGVVSALFGRVGERVGPERAVAAITGSGATRRSVRFRIAPDVRPPAVGTEVRVERLGFPLTPALARVTGVGTTLDPSGLLIAEAAFAAPEAWPARTPVRVITSGASLDAILVPFGSVWYADDGSARVWAVAEDRTIQPRAVTLGRAVGDRVVVETGLVAGESFVARAEPTLEAGQSLSTTTAQPQTAAPAGGDGHDHEH